MLGQVAGSEIQREQGGFASGRFARAGGGDYLRLREALGGDYGEPGGRGLLLSVEGCGGR